MSNEEQGAFDDVVIEDTELAEYLGLIADNEEAYNAYRDGIRKARALLESKYSDKINIEDDGDNSGFLRCGVYRFIAKTNHREAEVRTPTINVKEGWTWLPFDVKKVDLFSSR